MIFRKDPRQNPAGALERYNLARARLYAQADKYRPFHNVWPEYRNDEEFYFDFVFNVWASQSQIKNFTEFLISQHPGRGQITA